MRSHRNPQQRLAKQPIPDNRHTTPTEPVPAPAPAAAPAPAPEEPEDDELDALVCVLRDQLRRADGFVTTAEKELMESWGLGEDDSDEDDDSDDSVQRRRCRVEDLVEAGKLAVREAQYTCDQLAAELALHRGDA